MGHTLKNFSNKALRYNKDKPRYDLIPTLPLADLAELYKKGAEKYEEDNWKKGMDWSTCIASLKRHLAAYELCEDYDKETNLLHITHVIWNAMALNEYYYTHPHLDDRKYHMYSTIRIGLDIDDILCDMNGYIASLLNINPTEIYHWTNGKWEEMYNKLANRASFWKNLPIKIKPEDIPFEPTCYITGMPKKFYNIRKEWLIKNNYPNVKLICTSGSKLESAKKENLNLFVDDNFRTFADLNKNGILCYLMDAPYNRHYDVGAKRIHNLHELNKIIKYIKI